MVQIVNISSSKKRKTNDPSMLPRLCLWFVFVTMAISYLVLIVILYSKNIITGFNNVPTSKVAEDNNTNAVAAAIVAEDRYMNKHYNPIPNPNKILPPPPSNNNNNQQNNQKSCLSSLSQLTPSERHPQKGPRHTVQPPPSSTTLVCCQTTAGGGLPLTIAVHPGWAPRGAERFLSMVEAGWFSTGVPLFRCLKGFLCQFGIPGNVEIKKKKELTTNLEDDPNWLPEGPTGRVNEDGVKRFAKGYLAFAGAGKNSRDYQLIVSLDNDRFLGGGSPWEVPWGEVVGETSFEVLDKIFTGYGEKGPGQGLLQRKGVTDKIRDGWPKLDYITSCEVVDKDS